MIRATSKITGRGQVQLPAEIRRIMGGEIGDSVLFTVQDDGKVVVEVIKKRKLSDLGGALKSSVVFTDLEHEAEATKEIWVSKRVKGTQHNGKNMD
ncbi:AbrB/MazE/SpoVT family DNA-binding domain-containing protein [Caldicellulosiruptor morganii]|uniref:AbrB/MazE/SpoVT family DNA-binding domain-containing protein n=1 Tax=Caldicellulosiruptor morganii TaxID=1387555 RepID=UPI0005EB1885|nr:AbrB/MazE/SpoVT family DNA-binding domain-containing protein [Caldicellulosiruptor morganii]